MNKDHDITNSVYHRNDPWDSIDEAIGLVRDGFAAIGIFCTMIAVIFWITGSI